MANQTEQEKAKAAEAKAKEEREAAEAKGLPKEIVKAVGNLQYRDSQGTPALDHDRKPVMRGGNPVMHYHPHMRPMTVADVVSHSINGSVLVIVSADGMKHRVMMNGKP